jgi:pyruvate-ferredoxin/flavodoxin oxidoreductase
MGKWAGALSAAGMKNLWGTVPSVIEMQSEADAAGVMHGRVSNGWAQAYFEASHNTLSMLRDLSGLLALRKLLPTRKSRIR